MSDRARLMYVLLIMTMNAGVDVTTKVAINMERDVGIDRTTTVVELLQTWAWGLWVQWAHDYKYGHKNDYECGIAPSSGAGERTARRARWS